MTGDGQRQVQQSIFFLLFIYLKSSANVVFSSSNQTHLLFCLLQEISQDYYDDKVKEVKKRKQSKLAAKTRQINDINEKAEKAGCQDSLD